jgi:hypothetical protein
METVLGAMFGCAIVISAYGLFYFIRYLVTR